MGFTAAMRMKAQTISKTEPMLKPTRRNPRLAPAAIMKEAPDKKHKAMNATTSLLVNLSTSIFLLARE
jgi:hypothetical protein